MNWHIFFTLLIVILTLTMFIGRLITLRRAAEWEEQLRRQADATADGSQGWPRS